MTPEENDRLLAEAIKKSGWTPPEQPSTPFDGLEGAGLWRAGKRSRALPRYQSGPEPRGNLADAGMLGASPILSMGILASRPGFAKGVNDPLPDNSVPEFAKPWREATRAEKGSWREGLGDMLMAPGAPGETWPLIGGAGPMIRQQIGGFIKDPVRQISEFSGYAPLTRARDAFADTDSPDIAYNVGRAVRGSGEGAMGVATVAGNVYGVGSNLTKAFKGLRPPAAPVEPVNPVIARTRDWAFKNMPPLSDDWQAMRGQFDDALANADGVNPDLARAYFQDNIERARDASFRLAGPGDGAARKAAAAGVRAAEAEARRKPNVWDGLDAQPAPAAAPQPESSPFAGIEPESALTAMSRAKTGGRADVLANPTEQQIFELRSKLASQGRNTALKYQMGPDGTAYVFPTMGPDGIEVAHASIARDMGFDKTLSDLPKGFIDGQNELDAFMDTAREYRQANRPALGAADQAAKAARDEELMRLAQAIEDAPDDASRQAAHAAFNDLLTKPLDAPRQPVGIEDWAPEWRAAYDKGLPMDTASRMARADQQFPIKAYAGHSGEYTPGGGSTGGIDWFTSDPANATDYANLYGGAPNVNPVRIGMKNPLVVENIKPGRKGGMFSGPTKDQPLDYHYKWVPITAVPDEGMQAALSKIPTRGNMYGDVHVDDIVSELNKGNYPYDGVHFKRVDYGNEDAAGGYRNVVDAFAVRDPAAVRSTSAAFDPDNIGKPTILGSNGGNVFEGVGRVRRPKSTLPTDPKVRQERLQGVRGSEPFSDERLGAMENKVVEMARNKFTDAEIAEELELAPQTVQVYRMNARNLGIEVPQNRALSAQDDVLRLAQKGLTNQQIAERLGKTPNNVKQQIFKLRRVGLLDAANKVGGAALAVGLPYLQYKTATEIQNANDPFRGLEQPGM